MKAIFIALTILTLGLASCMKDEIPVPSHAPGDILTASTELGTDYRYQAYYNFETNSFVKQHLKTDWDLGFESSASGTRIVLNASKGMAVSKTSQTNFNLIVDTVGSVWMHDSTSGDLNYAAFGDGQSYNGIYIVDRGYSYTGDHQGFQKIEILSVDNNEFQVHFAELDGSSEHTVTLTKDDAYNFTFLSFDTDGPVDIQPPKQDWDIVLGQYTHLFHNPYTPYVVTGVLSNRNGVEVAEVFDKAFADISIADIDNYSFTNAIDEIGYDWKTYNFDAGGFITHPEKNFIVKTVEGAYYKIHFVDFYNGLGEKGTPIFEVQAL